MKEKKTTKKEEEKVVAPRIPKTVKAAAEELAEFLSREVEPVKVGDKFVLEVSPKSEDVPAHWRGFKVT